jgi:type I restriction enzyme S subunit
MKAGWQTKSLEDVCLFLNGLWKGETPPFVNVGVIRNTNFTKDGTLDDSDIAYLDVEVKKIEKRRLLFGDVILEKSGGGPKQPVGRVVLFNKAKGEFSFSNFTSALRVKNPEELDFRFLHKYLYWLYISGITEKMQSHSTGIRNLDGNAYKAIEISIPPLPEQQRIVSILDEAFAGIAKATANAEKNLANACELFESYLQSVFTNMGGNFEIKQLGDVCDVIGGGTPSKDKIHSAFYSGDIRWATVRDMKTDLILDTQFRITREAVKNSSTNIIPKGNVVIATRVGLGKVCLIEHETAINQDLRGVVPKDSGKLAVSFLFWWLKSVAHLIVREGTGATVQGVKLPFIKSLKIPVPPIQEQRRILDTVVRMSSETKRLEAIYQQKLNALEELKKSILNQAFSGQLQ